MKLTAGALLKEHIVLERELGRGGMGVVWEAKHLGLDATVAVKVLHREALDSEEARTRFDREAKSVAKIDSPHVVKIFDVGVTADGEPFIVMERLSGRDLKAHIDERGPLSPEDVVTIVRQSCAALGRAHASGIVHRDIKPANVFLADGGAGVFVKLLDFGIAKVASAASGLTATEAILGTPYYMSPEQFIDARSIDRRSDLWSLAVVAYAALTGTLPFLGDSIGALAIVVHGGEFDPPSAQREGLPAALDAWFRRAFSVKADGRFQSADELASTFAAAANGEAPAPLAAPDRAGENLDPGAATLRGAPITGRAPVGAKLAAAPNESTSPFVGSHTVSPARAPDVPARAPAASQPWRTAFLVTLTLAVAGVVGWGASRLGTTTPTATPTIDTGARALATPSTTAEPSSAPEPSTPPVASAPESASASTSASVASASAVPPSFVAAPAGPKPTEGELRAAIERCWSSTPPVGAPTSTVTVTIGNGVESRGMLVIGPHEVGTKKAVQHASAFKDCVRAAAAPLIARIPVNPDRDAPVNSVKTTVTLPAAG